MSTGTGLNVSKANAYAVLTPRIAVNVSKASAYAVLTPQTGLNVSKANAYAVLAPNNTDPPSWPSFSFAAGTVGIAYSQSFDLSPAASPTTYTVTNGALPPGLVLANAGGDVGVLSGTPTSVGSYSFSITATNAYGSASQTFSITVYSPYTSAIAPVAVALAGGVVGVPYSETISVRGGTAPYAFVEASGSLPTGTAMSSGGVISGTPTVAATAGFTVAVTDANGNTGSQSFTISITAPVSSGGSCTFAC